MVLRWAFAMSRSDPFERRAGHARRPTLVIAAYGLHALAAPMVGSRPMLLIFERARPLIGERAAALIPVLLFIALIGVCMEYLKAKALDHPDLTPLSSHHVDLYLI